MSNASLKEVTVATDIDCEWTEIEDHRGGKVRLSVDQLCDLLPQIHDAIYRHTGFTVFRKDEGHTDATRH